MKNVKYITLAELKAEQSKPHDPYKYAMTPGKKKHCPEYASLVDKAFKSMEGRPRDPRRESAEQIVDVYPSRDRGGTGDSFSSSFRGRVKDWQRLSRKHWDKMRLDDDREQLRGER